MKVSKKILFSAELSESELESWMGSILSLLDSKTILLLVGEVGAGKTTFVGHLLKKLGAQQGSSSPSFALHQEYTAARGLIDHVDLYRLQSEDDLESTGFWDLMGKSQGLVVIEWAQLLNYENLPWNWKKIEIEIQKKPLGRKFVVSELGSV